MTPNLAQTLQSPGLTIQNERRQLHRGTVGWSRSLGALGLPHTSQDCIPCPHACKQDKPPPKFESIAKSAMPDPSSSLQVQPPVHVSGLLER